MISAALFVIVTAVVLMTLRNANTNQQRLDQREQALRGCLLAVEHIRSELAVAWVEDVDGNVITYHLPSLDASGEARVTSTGDVIWGPAFSLSLDGEQLMRKTVPENPLEAPVERPLSRLGPGAVFTVEKLTSTLIRVTVRSTYGTGYELMREYRLLNQS
jgi:type II secretory pathway pseudopilin PulG